MHFSFFRSAPYLFHYATGQSTYVSSNILSHLGCGNMISCDIIPFPPASLLTFPPSILSPTATFPPPSVTHPLSPPLPPREIGNKKYEINKKKIKKNEIKKQCHPGKLKLISQETLSWRWKRAVPQLPVPGLRVSLCDDSVPGFRSTILQIPRNQPVVG